MARRERRQDTGEEGARPLLSPRIDAVVSHFARHAHSTAPTRPPRPSRRDNDLRDGDRDRDAADPAPTDP